jgi:hypothetical protein
MRMLLVVYEAGIDEDLQHVLDEAKVSAYTKLTGATGTGRRGHRFGTQVWPGTNNLLWIALPDDRVAGVVERLRGLKESYMKPPALQIFSMPVDVME